jgi:fatty acid desaturase/predicted heme/steroid binding protein
MCKGTTTDSITSTPTLRKFTWGEIDKSVPKKVTLDTVAAQPSYAVIHGKVYDLGGEFVKWHPGGAVAISQLGKDATDAFDVFHKQSTHELLANFYVGDLADAEVKAPNAFAKDVQELRTVIEKSGWYKSNKLWYTGKVIQTASLAVISVTMLALWGRSFFGMLASAAVCALFFQQSGWLAHDFLHHQVFENRKFGNYAGLIIGNVFQGFSVAWWKHKHSTHHSVPNVHEQDPDIDTLPFLAWSEHALEGFADFDDATLTKFMVTYQPIIYFPLLSFARMTWAIQSILWNKPNSKKLDAFPTMTGLEKICIALHYSWYFGAAFTLTTPLYAVMWILTSQCVCGILLAAVFSVNHNGMPVYSRKEAKDMDYYELSIVTGRNVVASAFNKWFTGGLNFQIEHHMFPTIPRHNLPKVAPLVESLCKKHGVPYHTTSLGGGLVEVVQRLTNVAGQARRIKRQ